jgi:acyl phosphate:glycerol-3-phosphate acyltransferase
VNVALCIPIGYFIGGIPTGIIFCRLIKGVDPRKIGSGSMGATNVSRVLGKGWAVVVLLLDMAKGFLPVRYLVPAILPPGHLIIGGIVTAAALVCGHVWTPYAKFHGGKGVATGAGALVALDPVGVACALGVWVIFFLIFRIVSLASMAAALSLPLILIILGQRSPSLLCFAVIIALFILYTHRANLLRLIHGQEKRVF